MVWAGWVRVLEFFDLLSAGRPAFSKLMTVAVLVAAIATGHFGLGIAVACIAGSFGRSVFLAFLQSRKSE